MCVDMRAKHGVYYGVVTVRVPGRKSFFWTYREAERVTSRKGRLSTPFSAIFFVCLGQKSSEQISSRVHHFFWQFSSWFRPKIERTHPNTQLHCRIHLVKIRTHGIYYNKRAAGGVGPVCIVPAASKT